MENEKTVWLIPVSQDFDFVSKFKKDNIVQMSKPKNASPKIGDIGYLYVSKSRNEKIADTMKKFEQRIFSKVEIVDSPGFYGDDSEYDSNSDRAKAKYGVYYMKQLFQFPPDMNQLTYRYITKIKGYHDAFKSPRKLTQGGLLKYYEKLLEAEKTYINGDDYEVAADYSFISDEKLLAKIEEEESIKPELKVQEGGQDFVRSEAVREYTKRRADGICMRCEKPSFKTDNGPRYLESHHILELSRGGADKIWNTVALCPQCHKQAHFGSNSDKEKIRKKIWATNQELIDESDEIVDGWNMVFQLGKQYYNIKHGPVTIKAIKEKDITFYSEWLGDELTTPKDFKWWYYQEY